MKKYLPFVFILLLLGISNQLSAQARRFVLIEHFTNASCSPCAAQNPVLDALLSVNKGSVQHIAYHTDWPGTDPMNAYNQAEVQARVNYYGVDGVPDCLMEGNIYHGGPAGVTQNMLNDVAVEPSPIRVVVKETSNGTVRTVQVKVFTLATVPTANYKIRGAVCEKLKHYNTAPGTNGEKDFPDVFRKAIPSSTGDVYTPAAVGDSATFVYTYPLDLANWDTTKIYSIVFIQNDATKEVLNSGSSFAPFWELVPVDACFYEGTPESSKTFNFRLVNLRNTPLNSRVKIIADHPVDWSASFTVNASVYNDSVDVTIPAKSTLDLELNVDIGTTKALGNYTVSMAETGTTTYNPQLLNAYIISGVYELIVNNEGSWGDGSATNSADFEGNYIKGLEYAGSDYFGVTRLGALMLANKYNCLSGVNNYYLNIGWSFPALTDPTVDLLKNELDSGKNLFISGQDIGWDVWTSSANGGHPTVKNKAFYTDYMNAQFLNDGSSSDNKLIPEATDSVFGLLATSNLTNVYGGTNFFPDEINATGLGSVIFYYNTAMTKNAGVRSTDGNWKVVYLAPSLEQVSDTSVRKDIIKNSHDWFGGPSTGVKDKTSKKEHFMSQNFPNPTGDATTIRLSGISADMSLDIVDLTGRVLKSFSLAKGMTEIRINTSSLRNGSYLYRLMKDNVVLETRILQVIH